MRRLFVSISLLLSLALVACEDEVSSLGSEYFRDTISYRSDTLGGSALGFSASEVRSVTSGTKTYNIGYLSTTLLIGKATLGTSEEFESWGVIRFPAQPATNVESIALKLRTYAYAYGDTASNQVDLKLYFAEGPTGEAIDQSRTSLTLSDLTPVPGASFSAAMRSDSAGGIVSITIDSSFATHLPATSLVFVVVPGEGMKNVRSFSSIEASGNIGPALETKVKSDTGLVTKSTAAVMDYYLVNTKRQPQPLELLGGAAWRTRLKLNVDSSLILARGIPSIATINNAVLLLRINPELTRKAMGESYSVGPVLMLLEADASNGDSSGLTLSFGTPDPKDPTLYRFQMRAAVERWLRAPATNFGLELRAGVSFRTFDGKTIGVEDLTLNHWTLYGTDDANEGNRPRLVITSSSLR